MSVVGSPSAPRRRVELGHRRARLLRRLERGRGRAVALLGRKDGEHAVADQLEHVARMVVDRRDDRVGVVVEQRDDLLGLGAVGDAGVVAQVAEPQHRLDPVGDAALDAAVQHPPPRVAAEVGLDQRLGDPAERRRLDREPEVRNEARRCASTSASEKPSGRSVIQPE